MNIKLPWEDEMYADSWVDAREAIIRNFEWQASNFVGAWYQEHLANNQHGDIHALSLTVAGTLDLGGALSVGGAESVGGDLDVAGHIFAIKTTEQLRLSYDTLSFVSFTVANNAVLTLSTPFLITGAARFTSTQTYQLNVGYDISNKIEVSVDATGNTQFKATGTNPNITLTPGGTGQVICSSPLALKGMAATPVVSEDMSNAYYDLANNGTVAWASTGYALVLISESTAYGETAVILFARAFSVPAILQTTPGTVHITTTAGHAASINVYYSAGTIVVENKSGASSRIFAKIIKLDT